MKIKYLRDLLSIILTKNSSVCFVCIKKTGGCCQGVRIPLFKYEAKLFQKRFDELGVPKDHSLTLHDDDNDIMEYFSASDPCMFLSKDNECTIYDERPLICRMYPVLWQEQEDSENLEYFVDFACPLSHRLPLRNFNEWVKKYEKSIEEMGELDFDCEESNYVNMTALLDEVNIVELATRADLIP